MRSVPSLELDVRLVTLTDDGLNLFNLALHLHNKADFHH